MTNLYANLVVRYIYNETDEFSKPRARLLIKSDMQAQELYEQLKEGKWLLRECFPLKQPRKALIDNILRYAVS